MWQAAAYQRRLLVEGHRVDLGTGSEQHHETLVVVVHGGLVQRRRALEVLRIDVGSLVHEVLEYLEMSTRGTDDLLVRS